VSKISAYAAITSVHDDDLLVVVDVHDTSMAATGTDKKMTLAQLPAPVIVNAGSYGTDPSGAADSTTAIQNALNAASSGDVVYLSAGTYKTTASLVFNSDGITLRGAGMGATVIKPASGATFDVISTPIPGSAGLAGFIRNYVTVQDMHLDCSNMTGTTTGRGNGVHFYGTRYGAIRDVLVTSCPNWAILLDGDNTGPGLNFGYNNDVRHCIFDVGAAGILCVNCEANDIVQNIFKYATSATAALQPAFGTQHTTAYHLYLTSGYQYVAGNVFGNLGTYTTEAIRCENSGPARIVGNRFDQVRYQAFHNTAGPQIFADNQLGNPSAIGSVPAIDVGAGGTTVTGNSFDITNGSAHWTWCIFENGAYVGNCYTGNHLINGSSGSVSVNGGSTGGVNTSNSLG